MTGLHLAPGGVSGRPGYSREASETLVHCRPLTLGRRGVVYPQVRAPGFLSRGLFAGVASKLVSFIAVFVLWGDLLSALDKRSLKHVLLFFSLGLIKLRGYI